MPYAHAACERTRRGARHVAGPRVRFTARRSRLASFTTRRTRSPATLARWRRVAQRICASRAHATRWAGRSEATARPSPCMESRRVGSRAKSDDEGHRIHRFRVPRAPGNRARLPPTAFFVQLPRSTEYPAILRPYDLRFYRRNTRVYSTDSVSDTKNVMDTTLAPTPGGENRAGVRRLTRREARERGTTGEHAKGSDPETRSPRHVSLFSYKASSAQAAGTRRV